MTAQPYLAHNDVDGVSHFVRSRTSVGDCGSGCPRGGVVQTGPVDSCRHQIPSSHCHSRLCHFPGRGRCRPRVVPWSRRVRKGPGRITSDEPLVGDRNPLPSRARVPGLQVRPWAYRIISRTRQSTCRNVLPGRTRRRGTKSEQRLYNVQWSLNSFCLVICLVIEKRP